jgi:hypothetical protein
MRAFAPSVTLSLTTIDRAHPSDQARRKVSAESEERDGGRHAKRNLRGSLGEADDRHPRWPDERRDDHRTDADKKSPNHHQPSSGSRSTPRGGETNVNSITIKIRSGQPCPGSRNESSLFVAARLE